jgi:hypothetical protein
MTSDKIDGRLRQEIERIERSGTIRTLSVIVETEGTDTEPLRQRMEEMGVTGVARLVLAAGIVADLTPAQVRAIAADTTVKRIIWNAVDKVTL